MADTVKPVVSLSDLPLAKRGNGGAFEAEVNSFARSIGSTGLGAMLHVVQPGKKAFPRHAHHQIHELFVILEGEGTYRFGNDSYPVKAGDVCAAPTGGAETAHQLVNTGSQPLKYLGISTMADTEVVEYPDSQKFAAISRYDWATGSGGVRFIGRAKDSLGYFDREE